MSKSFEQTGTGAGSFGERLRREREMRGISLDDIAATTKIGTRLLRALEEEHFDLLPGGIFNKGYVRAYAKYVGIDEEQAVAEYLHAVDEVSPDVRLIAQQNTAVRTDPIRSHSSRVRYRSAFPLIPAIILLLVIAGAAGGWQLYRQRQRERVQAKKTLDVTVGQPVSAGQSTNSNSNGNFAAQPAPSTSSESVPEVSAGTPANSMSSGHAAVQTVEAAESSPNLSGSNADVTADTSASKGGAQFEVTVRAKEHARVEIKSDGKILVKGVMNPAEVKTIHATNKVVFWTANAGEVELSFNGKNVPLDSGENDEQVVVLTPRGLLPRLATQ